MTVKELKMMLNDMPDGDPIASVFWGAVGSVLAGLPFMTDLPPLGTAGVVSMLVLGVFQMGGAFLCLTIGLRTTQSCSGRAVLRRGDGAAFVPWRCDCGRRRCGIQCPADKAKGKRDAGRAGVQRQCRFFGARERRRNQSAIIRKNL